MAKLGRPTVRTPELERELLQLIASAVPIRYAAQAVGISYETARRWRRDDAEFRAALERAIGGAITVHLARVAEGATGWQGAAWILERRWPKHFARRDAPTITRVTEPALTPEVERKREELRMQMRREVLAELEGKPMQ